MMNILITGGAGYIGSHTCVVLLENGYDLVIIDNLSNSSIEPVNRIQKITGRRVKFYQADLRDKTVLEGIFQNHRFDAVIHFAGLKSVSESVKKPLEYYQNNIGATLVLCEVMQAHGVKNLVFSSSATVYGNPASVPIKEDAPTAPINPYGRTKRAIEMILEDIYHADTSWNTALLRYFNPVGAHPGGCIGEHPAGIPNNLMPHISQVAVGRLPELQVFGNDYPTPDGTGIRDYIHVMDLAGGHLKALERLKAGCGLLTYNLGTGRGYSVMEVIAAFEKASGKKVPYKVVDRRAGDIPVCYADPSLAERELGWKAKHGIDEMCADTWRWQSMNPKGYEPAG